MKTKLFVLFAGILALGSALAVPAVSEAYQNKGPQYSPERHAQMTQAFESADYNAWKQLMTGRGRVTQVINEGNFARFAQAHKLAEQGDTKAADTIRAELGLGLKNGSGKGTGMGRNAH